MGKRQWSNLLWDAWCIASVIGIWPRYIEPRFLVTNRLTLAIPHFPTALSGLKVLHFSDLHWSGTFSSRYQRKLTRRINSLTPDLILFSGDFLCRSQLENSEGLRHFLDSLKARIGCFAVLGNHDYADFVTVNPGGDYDVEEPSKASTLGKGFRRLFHSSVLTKKTTEKARQVPKQAELIKLLEQSQFQLLNNESKLIAYHGHWINICGLEEYTLGRCQPSTAFANYNAGYPGIVLSHNPDSTKILTHFPGDLILCGHTHGGQVNLPWMWKRFACMEHPELKSGLKRLGKKLVYINRGISSIMNFRWFAPPELTLFVLKSA